MPCMRAWRKRFKNSWHCDLGSQRSNSLSRRELLAYGEQEKKQKWLRPFYPDNVAKRAIRDNFSYLA